MNQAFHFSLSIVFHWMSSNKCCSHSDSHAADTWSTITHSLTHSFIHSFIHSQSSQSSTSQLYSSLHICHIRFNYHSNALFSVRHRATSGCQLISHVTFWPTDDRALICITFSYEHYGSRDGSVGSVQAVAGRRKKHVRKTPRPAVGPLCRTEWVLGPFARFQRIGVWFLPIISTWSRG